MQDILDQVGKAIVPLRIYSIVVKTTRVAFLHMGVYHSLDEAFAAVKMRVHAESLSKGQDIPNIDFWMWEVMPANLVLTQLLGTNLVELPQVVESSVSAQQDIVEEKVIETTDYVRQMYDMKNELIKRLIDTKDTKMLSKATALLSKSEIKLIKERINNTEVKPI